MMSRVNALPKSSAIASQLRWMPSVGSTNDELAALVRSLPPTEVPDFTVVATDDQRAGRGRLSRTWMSPAGACLAASVLIRPSTPSGRNLPPTVWGWYPLLAGLAMTRALRTLVPATRNVALKWPNDVLVDSKKVCGILCEIAIDPEGATTFVLGSGINLTLDETSLPTPEATSLALVGVVEVDLDTVLSAYLIELRRVTRVFEAAEADVEASGLANDVSRECGTLTQRVRVDLPGSSFVMGAATGIDSGGRLVVTLDSPIERAGERFAVSVGDVTHVRVVDWAPGNT